MAMAFFSLSELSFGWGLQLQQAIGQETGEIGGGLWWSEKNGFGKGRESTAVDILATSGQEFICF